MERIEFEQKILIELLKKNTDVDNYKPLVKLSIDIASEFYSTKNISMSEQLDRLPIYDASIDYGERIVKVIHEGDIYYVSGINSINRKIAGNAN